MQFMVFAVGGDLSFRFSDCGSDWKLGTVKGGVKNASADAVRCRDILDCVGKRHKSPIGPVWHVSRDDLKPIGLMECCRRICAGTEPTSTFDLCARVVRAIAAELQITDTTKIQQIAEEVNRSFYANAKTEGKR